LRGEGQGEGWTHIPTFAYAAAPHPDLLVVLKARLWRDKYGEKEKFAPYRDIGRP
jgi:hypothetical protein